MHCYIYVQVEPEAQIFCRDPCKPEIEEINDGSLSSLEKISTLSDFWSIAVLNERECSILHILYCYTLQQCIFLAFCNSNFNKRYRMFACIFLRNQHCYSRNDVRIQLVPFSAIPRSRTWKRAFLQNLEIHTKLTKRAATTIFLQWWSGKNGNLY